VGDAFDVKPTLVFEECEVLEEDLREALERVATPNVVTEILETSGLLDGTRTDR
jgi:hypothetical protein